MTLFSTKKSAYKNNKAKTNLERKKEKTMKMWSSFLFVLLMLSAQSGRAIVLDRNQLATWEPNYLTETKFFFYNRQITSISTGTFTGLSQLQKLDLKNETKQF